MKECREGLTTREREPPLVATSFRGNRERVGRRSWRTSRLRERGKSEIFRQLGLVTEFALVRGLGCNEFADSFGSRVHDFPAGRGHVLAEGDGERVEQEPEDVVEQSLSADVLGDLPLALENGR